jgi:fibronectin-binding autotransporter adhesin
MSTGLLLNYVRKLLPSGIRRARRHSARAMQRNAPTWRSAVETLEDRVTPSNFNVITLSDGPGSAADVTLRYAVNNSAAGDTVTFDPSISFPGATITTASTLTIGHNLTIIGPGAANMFVNGDDAHTVFSVANGVSVSVSGLTITNGLAASGAGIYNLGNLSLTNDAVSGNGAINNMTIHYGAGIDNLGVMNITGTTISGNTTYTRGGGIANSGSMNLSNSTIANNAAYTYGGGIYNTAGNLSLTDCTISGNAGWNGSASVPHYGGGIAVTGGTVTMNNTIVAGNSAATAGPDIYGTVAVANYCLVGNIGGTTITTGAPNLFGVSADLSPLTNKGGPTQTMALLPGSPAIGHGGGAFQSTDQRGIARPAVPDIGAFELQRVTSSAPNVPDATSTITINGSSFDPIAADNTVAFNLGVVGTVTLATSTQLTVTLAAPPTALGVLTAVVTTDGASSGAPVQVANEISSTWVVTDASGIAGSGTLADVTLPYAVAHALGGDTIALPGGLGVITLNATLPLTQSITIDGNASWSTFISGNNSVQVFHVNSGVTATISGVTIENGLANNGAGINNAGNLTLSDDDIVDCGSASNTTNRDGAGIYNSGTLLMAGSTVSNNVSCYNGGGIYNSGTANLYDSTIFANATYTFGGGIANFGTLSLVSCTVAGNVGWDGIALCPEDGGGIFNNGTTTLDNTIVAGNNGSNGPDIYGPVTTNYSLIGNISGTTYSGSNNLLGFSAGLASSLAYNGGSVPNLALRPGSVALETGDPAQAGIISENYAFRPLTPDIGAYQTLMTVTSSAANIPDDSPTITINGSGFSTTPADNTVTFNDGVVGTVVIASSTQLVVDVNTPPTSLGSLTAVVHSGSDFNGLPVQVGTEVNATWTVTDAAGMGGSLTDITLPYAVAHALGGDTIDFAPSLSGSTINLAATLTMSQNVAITGLGADNLAVSGGGLVQDFFISSGVTSSITGLRIEDGLASNGGGGGILNLGSLSVANCTISGNNSGAGGEYDASGSGGGILNIGTISLTDSTISGNTGRYGGGFENFTAASQAMINRCTFTGNTATLGSASGVNNYFGGTLNLTNSTLAYNTGGLGTVFDNGTTLNVTSCTIAFNSSGGVFATTLDNSIVGGNTGAGDIINVGTSTHNLIGVTANLATALANNGGATQTLLLLPGSPAIGTGDPAQAGTTSQNALVRPAAVDIGAYQTPPVGPAPHVASVVVNGGAPAYTDSNGLRVSLAGQNSIVEQILVTFNEPVTLDAGALTITNDAAGVTVLGGPAPNALPVTAIQTPVGNSPSAQWMVTFSGTGTTPIPGGLGNAIKDGLYILNTIGSKVHANGQTALADNHAGFFALYGSVAASDNIVSSTIGDGGSEVVVDAPDFSLFKNTFAAESDLPSGPSQPFYDVALDSNLDGVIDATDFAKFKANFGADWVF